MFFFFFQAEDGIRDWSVTGVQTCALPISLQFKGLDSVETLKITADDTFDVTGLEGGIRPQMDVTLTIHRKDGTTKEVEVLLRIDTPIEVDYYLHGGILPFVLRELVAQTTTAKVTA